MLEAQPPTTKAATREMIKALVVFSCFITITSQQVNQSGLAQSVQT
jgi:hypothetical protein